MMNTKIVLMLSALVLAGCSLPGKPVQAIRYYVLTDPGPVVPIGASHPGTLLVREMEAPPFYQEPHLAFSRAPGTRGRYQYAQWSESSPRRLSWMLRQRLEAAGVFRVVAPLGSGVHGDYRLNTRLIDFYHDASHAPGTALMVLEADLVRHASAELVARRIFVSQMPVASFDAAGAADALGRGANQVMDELAVWLARVSLEEAR